VRLKFQAILLVLMLLISRDAAADEGYDLWRGVQRISYETVTLSPTEKMGLAGFQYLMDVSPRLYAGLGVYGAVVGERGGFFTGGFEAGLKQPLAGPLSVDAGLFLGGGGGGSAPQGGGLMVRPHLGLLYAFKDVRLCFEYALVDFPNGDIRSRHAAVFIDLPFDSLRVVSERPEDLAAVLERASHAVNREVRFDREHLTARYQIYSPPHAVMDIDGVSKTGAIQMTGFEYGRELGGKTYLFVETSGAAGGNADGYAEVLFGGGSRVPLLVSNLLLDARFSVGAGGGGRVDTGGGGLAKASLGLKFMTGDYFSIDTRTGYVESGGKFQARTVEFGLSYALDAAVFGKHGAPGGLVADSLRIYSWRTRFTGQQYTSLNASMRNGREDGAISLLGAKLDAFLGTTAYYLTGQAQSAFAGGAGGYSVGLMGIGYLSGPIAGTSVHVFAEALGGAAGGGGIKVGGGAVVQPSIGVLYDVSGNTGIEVSVNRIRALHGGLDSTAAGLGVVYRFSTAGKRIANNRESAGDTRSDD
jgi:hypothetical protein